MGKTATFVDKNVDLKRLAKRVYSYLNENKFEVAYSKDEEPATWFFIQARKISTIRTIAGMRRSTDITIKGKPEHFDVIISTGEWGKNMMSSAPLLLGAALGKDNDYAVIASVAAAGVSSVIKWYTARKFETNLKNFIRDQINFLEDSYLKEPKVVKKDTTIKMDSMEYPCDYVSGYPNWNEHILGGRMVLELYQNGKNKIIFLPPSSKKKITLPAEMIEEANMISKKKGFSEDDLMIQLKCKNKSGENIMYPIFNISDDIIRNVVSGISELVSDDKVPNMMSETVTTNTTNCRNCNTEISPSSKFCSSCGFRQ